MADNGHLQVHFTNFDVSRMGNALRKTFKVSKEEIEQKLAEDFLAFFRKELKAHRLGLVDLKASTIYIKRKMNFEKPASPLFGRGDNHPNSYTNLIVVSKDKKGTRVGPQPYGRHHSGMMISKLVAVHDAGFRRGATLVPSRNALAEAQAKFKPKASGFSIAKIIKDRFRDAWNS